MKKEPQKKRVIYMTDKQWEELGKTAKKTEFTRSALVREAIRIEGYTK